MPDLVYSEVLSYSFPKTCENKKLSQKPHEKRKSANITSTGVAVMFKD